MSDTSGLTLLGNGGSQYSYENPTPDILEVFANQHRNSPYVVGLDCFEFTSLCPMTGQPDYGKIWIDYVPDQLCVESKSLKLYLVSYRNHGAFHEDCVNTIADHLVGKIDPLYIRVFGDFHVRGGIAIKPMVLRKRKGLAPEAKEELRYLFEAFDRLSNRQ